MEPACYRIFVVREDGFPTIGTLNGWASGNSSALRHLEELYPDWIQITIQKIYDNPTSRIRAARNFCSV